MLLKPPFENLYLRFFGFNKGEGSLDIPSQLYETFLQAPYDLTPGFHLPPYWKTREHDHPRYARFCYALAKTYDAHTVLEIGTSAGGTTTGWSRAIAECIRRGEKGKIVCVDNDSYANGVYPEITKQNVQLAGLPLSAIQFYNGDSKDVIPSLHKEYERFFDIHLVDGDHSYEGAMRDMRSSLPLVKKGGIMAVHDVDPHMTTMDATPEHPSPVYEAFMHFVQEYGFKYYIFRFIRKHLGILRVE